MTLKLRHSNCGAVTAPLQLHHYNCVTTLVSLQQSHCNCATVTMPLQLHCNCATATEPLQLQHCNCATPNRSLQEVVEVVREENPEEEQEEDTEKVTAREKLTLVEQLDQQRLVGKKLKKSEKEARLKKFVDENRKDLAKVARKSSFAPHRLPANDTEHLVNIVATAKGLTQKTVGEQSVFQVKVFGTLRDLKAKGYPQNEMEEIMRKSNDHISTILTMQQKKITGFFTFSPQSPSHQTWNNRTPLKLKRLRYSGKASLAVLRKTSLPALRKSSLLALLKKSL